MDEYNQHQQQENESYKAYREHIEGTQLHNTLGVEIAVTENNSAEIKQKLEEKKDDIEYVDEHNRLMYYYPEKIDQLRASVYAKYRKAEIVESLIKESFNLLQSKISEQQNKVENVDEMYEVVE